MTLASSIIQDALQEIGVIDGSEAPGADDEARMLRIMNALLDSWNIQNLIVYVQNNYTYNLIANQAAYTIGAAANFAGPRLTGISDAFVTYQSVDYPLVIIDDQQYNDIPLKTQTAIIPLYINFAAYMPLSRVTLWPVPSQILPITLLANQFAITTPVVGTTDLIWPPGYDRAFVKCLAVEASPIFGKEASPTLVQLMTSAMKVLKRQNKRTPVLRYDPALYNDRINASWNWIYG